MPYEPSPEAGANSGVQHRDISSEDAGQRIDNYLLRELKGVPRSHVYRVLRRGEVRVNGGRAKPEYRLTEGDRLRLPPVRQSAAAQHSRIAPTSMQQKIQHAIIHEDADVLVLNKPAGMATHGGSGIAFGAIEALRDWWADGHPNEKLELVHRLDRETSGCLLIARRRSRLRELHALLREGAIEKRYLTLLAGRWPHGRQAIDAPLMTRQLQGGERMVKVHVDGKEALSVFQPVQFFGKRATLMEVELKTGRTHQIRVHAAHAGHAIAGDEKYGDRQFNDQLRQLGLRRMFLHAHLVSFTWPGGKTFNVSVPLDDELKSVLDRL